MSTRAKLWTSPRAYGDPPPISLCWNNLRCCPICRRGWAEWGIWRMWASPTCTLWGWASPHAANREAKTDRRKTWRLIEHLLSAGSRWSIRLDGCDVTKRFPKLTGIIGALTRRERGPSQAWSIGRSAAGCHAAEYRQTSRLWCISNSYCEGYLVIITGLARRRLTQTSPHDLSANSDPRRRYNVA